MMLTTFLALTLTLFFARDDGTPAPAKAQAASQPAAASRLKTLVWDFGVLPPGKEAKHRFTITNTSTMTWTVKNVSKTCACTVGEMSTNEIKPGAAASLDVVLRVPNKEGSVHQAFMVEFTDRNTPLFNLAIQGEARNPVSAVPANLDFGRVATGTHPTQTIELRNYTDQDVTITKVEVPVGLQVKHERAEIKETTYRPRQMWTLTAHLDPEKFKADFRTSVVVVHTGSKSLEPVRIPVLYRGKALLTGNPARLGFGTVELGQAAEKSVLVDASPALGAVTEKDVICKHPWTTELEATVTKTASAQRFLVTLRWRPRQPGKLTGNVEITVRDKTAPPVRITVTGQAP